MPITDLPVTLDQHSREAMRATVKLVSWEDLQSVEMFDVLCGECRFNGYHCQQLA